MFLHYTVYKVWVCGYKQHACWTFGFNLFSNRLFSDVSNKSAVPKYFADKFKKYIVLFYLSTVHSSSKIQC